MRKGQRCSDETKRKISDAMMGNRNQEKHRSKETREKISRGLKGRTLSEEHIRKSAESRRGQMPWNKGRKMSGEYRKNVSDSKKGPKNPNYGKKTWMFGKHHSIESRKLISDASRGENHPNWLGGKSFEPYGVEFNEELRKLVRKRDNHQCQICGIHREKPQIALNVHHIDYCKTNNSIDNLVSLCGSCHTKTNVNRDEWSVHFKEIMAFLPLSHREGCEIRNDVLRCVDQIVSALEEV